MNQPPHFLVDVFEDIVSRTKTALALPVLGYHYGHVRELNETLMQYAESPLHFNQRFPLVWLVQPLLISRGEIGNYGTARGLRLFIIHGSEINYKAKDRMTNVFKPILYPIYGELIKQADNTPAIHFTQNHKVVDRYFWGQEQQSVLNDVIDCMELYDVELKIKNKIC